MFSTGFVFINISAVLFLMKPGDGTTEEVLRLLFVPPCSLYSDPVENCDPALDPRGCSAHFVLHSTGALILSEHFSPVRCRSGNLRNSLLKFVS